MYINKKQPRGSANKCSLIGANKRLRTKYQTYNLTCKLKF